MFHEFFYFLKWNEFPISMKEWLLLMEALDKGLCKGSFSHFYFLCRLILVKSEMQYDLFDTLFLEYFQDIDKNQQEEISQWIQDPKEINLHLDKDQVYENAFHDLQEIKEMFEERKREQTERHDGGTYWIGTGGGSVFGNSGVSERAIRIGGKKQAKRALEVVRERNYTDFRTDKMIDLRQFQLAFRRLRQFSSLENALKTELDIQQTIHATCQNAGNLKLVYERPRKNKVKLLLLMDSGGSMTPYSRLCNSLFQAVNKSNHFKDLKIYYFHNCIYRKLYTDPQCITGKWIETEWLFHNLSKEYKTVIVGDGAMSYSELMTGSMYETDLRDHRAGIDWLKEIKRKFPYTVWLNPTEETEMSYYYGSNETVEEIKKIFDMYLLSLDGLEQAIKKLLIFQ